VRSVVGVGTTVLCCAVFVQLILGALMRHHHRQGLADTGILLTGGTWVPAFDNSNEILVIMFLHKYWGFLVAMLTISLAIRVVRQMEKGQLLRRLIRIMAILLGFQIFLGICVIITGKSFWITNFHVLNGLLILAVSFVAAMFSWRSVGSIAAESEPGVLPSNE